MGICVLSSGGVTGTVVDPKLVFAAAHKVNTTDIILARNHPSENLSPSGADRTLTKKLKQAGSYLDVSVLDHLIIGSRGGIFLLLKIGKLSRSGLASSIKNHFFNTAANITDRH